MIIIRAPRVLPPGVLGERCTGCGRQADRLVCNQAAKFGLPRHEDYCEDCRPEWFVVEALGR